MSAAARMVAVTVDGARAFQPIDGFGVNINARHWGDGALAPVVDDLIDDLGATLFRVDIWGTCHWPFSGIDVVVPPASIVTIVAQ